MNRAKRRALAHKTTPQLKPIAASVAAIPTVEEPPIVHSTAEPISTASPAQSTANRSNAQLSTGPKTEAGKAKVSHNAVKTALTGQTILLPTDDIAEYQKLGQIFINHYKPATFEEESLVQSLIDAEWRLRRIPSLEAGIFAVGRRDLAESVPAHLLEVEVYLKYERNLKNLYLQENRLRRNREKDLKSLQEIQAARLEKEALLRKLQQQKEKQSQLSHPPSPEPKIGFEFASPEAAQEIHLQTAA